MSGYIHRGYAESLSEFGKPRQLVQSGGWILERTIPRGTYRDAMGCYPIFCCRDWSKLHLDIEKIGYDLVSLSLVTDPFGDYDVVYLKKCFIDVVSPFKEHFVVDLSKRLAEYVSKHHRRNARKALMEVEVIQPCDPSDSLEDWTALYAVLVKRHNIKGIRAFSRRAFEIQLRVPGLVMFQAVHKGCTVGILLWYVQGDVGYYHLGAFSESGYELRASFALFYSALEYFTSTELRWLNLGAGAGMRGDCRDGLTKFKRGWSTGTRTVYFCGRVFDRAKYQEVTKGRPATEYFPGYRSAEFS